MLSFQDLDRIRPSTLPHAPPCCMLLSSQDLDRIRKAVALRSGANQPLSEFQMEANRSFLAVLDTYREAVVERVMSPPYYMSVPVVAMGAEGDGPAGSPSNNSSS